MKRKITILASIFIIVILLFANKVFATEKLNYNDGAIYVIDEIKPKTDTLGENVEFYDIDPNNNYIFINLETEKFYKVNEEECVEMSNQDILDFMHSKYHIHNFVEDDLNIYQEKMPANFNEFGYIVTEDKVVDANKQYFQKIENEHGGYEYKPIPIEDLNLTKETYLEAVFFVMPKSATIDGNVTYYEDSEGIYTKVENPIEENVTEYRIIGKPEDYISITKIGQMTQEAYDKIFPRETMMHYISYNEESKDVFIIANYIEKNKSAIYNSDGTVVIEYDEPMFMNPLGDKFFIVAKCDENWEITDNKITIIDTQGNTVLESENIPYLEVLASDEHTIYLKSREFDTNEFYNIYGYKLLSQDNQKYEGKDLQIKTSGELNRLSSVKVNGTELDASNYTKTYESTIIILKNEYLKTLALGTYTLELGYIDGTKIETKFEIDKIYTSDTKEEGNESNSGNEGDNAEGTTGSVTEEETNKDEAENTPSNNNNTNNSSTNNNDDANSIGNPETGDNIVLFIIILAISSIGIIFTTKIRKK